MEKNNSALFYTCSLIEYLGRKTKNKRKDIIKVLGNEGVSRIYEYSDIFHCEPIEKVANDFIQEYQIPIGIFDNVAECRYLVPNYWDIGAVFERVIEDSYEDKDIIKGIIEIFQSWLEESISDYNTDFYYQSRDYIAACYKEGEVLA